MPDSNNSYGTADACVAAEPTVAVRVVEAMWKGLEQAGIARDEFLRALGDSAALLADADGRLPVSALNRAWVHALARVDDNALGLHWVESLSPRTFSPISHLLAHAGSLRSAFGLISQYEKVFCDQPFCEVRECGAHAELRVLEGWTFGSNELERLCSEVTVAGLLLMVRDYGARDGSFHTSFRYRRPANSREYLRVLGPSVRFGQPFTGIVFERTLLDVKPPQSDADIQRLMRSVADRILLRSTRQAPYAIRVSQLLRDTLPSRMNMTRVAHTLGIGVRSLRRHLADEGTSFRQLECAALEALAKRLLREERRTIQETAYAMGFADATTFHRAFKQWTGTTPSAFQTDPGE